MNEVKLKGVVRFAPRSGSTDKSTWCSVVITPEGAKYGLDVVGFGEIANQLSTAREGDTIGVMGHLTTRERKDKGLWTMSVCADKVRVEPRQQAAPQKKNDTNDIPW